MSDLLPEDSLRSALETAEAAGDFLTVRSILISQPRSTYPAWILEPSNLTSWLIGALSRSITDAARSGNIESIRASFKDWRECSEPTRLPPVEKENVDWALVEALKRGNRQVVKVLLAEGAGVTTSVVRALADPKNSEGYGQSLFEDILQDLLVMGGWNVNLDQAIIQAAASDNFTLFKFLLTYNANPNVKNTYQQTPISLIASRGSLVNLQLLFSRGAEPDNNALHMALRRPPADPERFPILDLLLSRGADIDALETGNKGRPTSSRLTGPVLQRTPLFEAVVAGDLDAVRFLVKRGADVEVRNRTGRREGMSSLEAGEKSKSEEIRTIILGARNRNSGRVQSRDCRFECKQFSDR